MYPILTYGKVDVFDFRAAVPHLRRAKLLACTPVLPFPLVPVFWGLEVVCRTPIRTEFFLRLRRALHKVIA